MWVRVRFGGNTYPKPTTVPNLTVEMLEQTTYEVELAQFGADNAYDSWQALDGMSDDLACTEVILESP